jgi:hypothetical protein
LTPKFPLAALALLARSRLRKHGFEFAACFYPQWSHFQDPGKLRSSLARNSEAEIIVHPADADDVRTLEYPDIYSSQRVTEFQALRMLGIVPPFSIKES